MKDKLENDEDFIDKEETRLYSTSRGAPKLKEHPLNGTSFKLRAPFSIDSKIDKDKNRRKSSFAKRFFLLSILVLIVAVVYAGYHLFFSESREDFISKHIDIVMENAPFSRGGEPLPLSISIVNRNNVALKNIHIEVEYPRGSVEDTRDDFEHIRIDLPDINPGEKVNKSLSVILYGEQGSTKKIKSTLEYNLPDSSLTYTKESTSELTISSSPIILEVDAPKEIAPSQLYTMRLRITQNTKTLPPGALVSITFPRDFNVESMSRQPTFNVSTWALKTQKEGDYEDITVTGRFNSQEGDERSFRFFAGVPKDSGGTNIETSYVSRTHVVSLARPILDAYLLLGNEKGKTIAVNPDSSISGELVYRNRGSVAVVAPVFHLHVEGKAIDEASILPLEGFYDSAKNEMFWDKNTNAELGSIAPGKEGRLTFTFRVMPKTIDGPVVVKEPVVNLSLSFSGILDDGNNITQNLENIENATVRVTTEPTIKVDTIFANGELPPKIEKETVYQIKLSVNNTHNDITGGKLVAKIPFYAKWVGKVTKDEKVTYNPDTREVVWSLGDVVSGAGNTNPARSASIQISISPSLSQVDSAPEILQNIRFSGTDLFSNKDVKASFNNITTRITNGTSKDAIVVQ